MQQGQESQDPAADALERLVRTAVRAGSEIARAREEARRRAAELDERGARRLEERFAMERMRMRTQLREADGAPGGATPEGVAARAESAAAWRDEDRLAATVDEQLRERYGFDPRGRAHDADAELLREEGAAAREREAQRRQDAAKARDEAERLDHETRAEAARESAEELAELAGRAAREQEERRQERQELAGPEREPEGADRAESPIPVEAIDRERAVAEAEGERARHAHAEADLRGRRSEAHGDRAERYERRAERLKQLLNEDDRRGILAAESGHPMHPREAIALARARSREGQRPETSAQRTPARRRTRAQDQGLGR
ncbi:MAG: hypothetical protein Q4E05_03445 [Pseudoclavibacter sp.]|nr:hypothetical protein [Pseudoclavibacter sp.]